ncbi:alpha-ribazole phosphatase [Novosphingobium chloroacetimidivorans]|uniref:Alpha-ribazole phosphatase n=1 Tax=Novosphingobium chloroacetimidivorans TaxID=1428314 RepID=A0A7W7K9V8_9SPHN|nr:histidine phosphatase family protein [Novosphingobium chloroacetimidivorans]MBB4858912.1 alpha-ribazole phosphatase [Novosphingobium chloroacetimidivorans]
MSERILHLLRHGPPARTGLLLGHSDEPAMTADCPRMLALACALPLTEIVTSDLSRAAHQAATLAQRLDLPLTLDPRWRELDFGAWDGLVPEDVDREALQRFWADPEAHAPPGGERWSCLRARIAAALETLASQTLVVTHAGAMRAAVSALTGLDHRGVWAIDLPYRALLTVRIWPDGSGQVIALHGPAA